MADLQSGAWIQEWEESEIGWGIRPDGVYYYATEEDAKTYTASQLKDMRDGEKRMYGGLVPDEYSRPSGKPYFSPVSDRIAGEIQEKGYTWRHRKGVE